MKPTFALFAIALSAFCTNIAHSAPSRFTLASQDDWAANHGFYLNFENDTSAAGKSTLSTLKLVGGVADGKSWQYIFATPTWVTNHVYSVDLKVGLDKADLVIDGQQVGQTHGGFSPKAIDVTGDTIPDWASAPTEYQVVQTKLEIKDATGNYAASMPPPAGAATLFGGGSMVSMASWHYTGVPFTVHVEFRLEPVTVDKGYNTLVDRYGQPTYAANAGKVKSDKDIIDAIDAEEHHERGWSKVPFDQYGGSTNLDWHDTATGFYHLTTHNAFTWLIDPLGNPLYYKGVCTVNIPSGETTPVTGRESIFAWLPQKGTAFEPAVSDNTWGSEPGIVFVRFENANMIRKYGKSWSEDGTKAEKRRVRDWGFSGFAKWSANWNDVPSTPVLFPRDVPQLVRRPDFFDPKVLAQIKAALTSQMTPYLKSPVIVGWSYGNEMDECITTDEIKQILAKPAETPSRKALVDYAIEEIYGGDAAKAGEVLALSDADMEKLRQFYADKYYGAIHDLIKSIDPNHLFIGWWLVPHWWANENDWPLQAAHVDVLGIDDYARAFDDPLVLSLIKKTNKPVLIGEYSFPPDFKRTRGFGTYQSSVETPEEAGKLYQNWMKATATNPNIVGVCWFEMRDEGIAGRGPGHGPNPVYGEHFAFGLVDVTDTPRWALVDQVRTANLSADGQREAASKGK